MFRAKAVRPIRLIKVEKDEDSMGNQRGKSSPERCETATHLAFLGLSFAPFRGWQSGIRYLPMAHAMGYYLAPLSGLGRGEAGKGAGCGPGVRPTD